MIFRRPAIASAFLAAALFACACGGAKSSGSTTTDTTGNSTPQSPPTIGAHGTPGAGITASGAIRELDLQDTQQVQKLLSDTGGQFDQTQLIYGDLTGDGIDEAVVPIASGGTLGNLAYVVLSPTASGVIVLPLQKGDSSAGGIFVNITGGKLVDTRPEYGPDDPNCCPAMLRKTTYKWNGEQFVVDSTESIVNPNGGAKGTPSSH